MKHPKQSILSKDGISYLIPFVLITSCFAVQGATFPELGIFNF
jgi:FHS family L-fucose permease-like MFS transporter